MARRKGGLFLPLDVNFLDDPKIVRAGERAAVLYLAMALACKRMETDGRLELVQIDRLNVPSWRPRLAALLREGLVLDLQDGYLTLAAWFLHNDPAQVIQARRAADAERKRAPRPSGLRTESVRTPNVREEKRREEKNSLPPDVDCEHGVDRFASCLRCAQAVTA